jgi:hypothetical protein
MLEVDLSRIAMHLGVDKRVSSLLMDHNGNVIQASECAIL